MRSPSYACMNHDSQLRILSVAFSLFMTASFSGLMIVLHHTQPAMGDLVCGTTAFCTAYDAHFHETCAPLRNQRKGNQQSSPKRQCACRPRRRVNLLACVASKEPVAKCLAWVTAENADNPDNKAVFTRFQCRSAALLAWLQVHGDAVLPKQKTTIRENSWFVSGARSPNNLHPRRQQLAS